MDSRDIMMCQIYNERTGSVLLKIRFNATEGDQQGGGTQNSNIHFKRKSQKQLQRDVIRVQDRNQNSPQDNHISSRTRSKVESVRCDNSPSVYSSDIAQMDISEVASPATCTNCCSRMM